MFFHKIVSLDLHYSMTLRYGFEQLRALEDNESKHFEIIDRYFFEPLVYIVNNWQYSIKFEERVFNAFYQFFKLVNPKLEINDKKIDEQFIQLKLYYGMLLTKEETFESALFYFNLVIRDVFVESSKLFSND